MSVRAYPIKKIEYGEEMFNLWHDDYFVELLRGMGLLDELNEDGCGIIEITKSDLEDIEEIITEDIAEARIPKEAWKRAKEITTNIRKEMKKQGREYINLLCF